MLQINKILSEKITANRDKIADFFTEKFSKNSPLFYNSTDLRHSGFKLAPIDTNCFPAGFNNLSSTSKEIAKKSARKFLDQFFPQTKKIMIIPESHTRNMRYLENIAVLNEVLKDNYEVVVGSLIDDLLETHKIDLESGASVTLHPLHKKEDKIFTNESFEPDLIILNNDLTDGIPEILKSCNIPIIPSVNIGWHKRRKSQHFTIYNELAQELAQLIDIDPWLISSMHKFCDDVNFKEQKGIECLSKSVDKLLEKIQAKYDEYGITDKPYCYVKADSGTYGIAVWPVFSGAEVLQINKKDRNKMNMLKGSVQNTKVMIQEGIKTIDKINSTIAEPMIYLINAEVVGYLFRANEARDEKVSLNASGANFFDLENLLENQIDLGLNRDDIKEVYSVISKLAALATAIENQNL